MGYTNSPLVAFTLLSPNHSGQRTKIIDRISPHCVVGQCSAEGLGDWFHRPSTQASSNYGIDKNGRVGLYVEEKNRSWCTSSNENDQRAVTIELWLSLFWKVVMENQNWLRVRITALV